MGYLARIIIPYFGKLPWWIDFFILSCSRNQNISWLIYTNDVNDDHLRVDNVIFVRCSFDEYKKIISSSLGIPFDPADPYKLCDIKPFLGFIHQRELCGFRFWGWSDFDIIYGDLSRWLLNNKNYNIISSHYDRISGHFGFLRNISSVINIPFQICEWEIKLADQKYIGFDEHYITSYCLRPLLELPNASRFLHRIQSRRLRLAVRRVRMKEEFTTPLCGMPWRDGSLLEDQPDVWEWNDGAISSVRDGCESPYLHFMFFKNSRWNMMKKLPWRDESALERFKPELTTKRFFVHRRGISATNPVAPAA